MELAIVIIGLLTSLPEWVKLVDRLVAFLKKRLGLDMSNIQTFNTDLAYIKKQ